MFSLFQNRHPLTILLLIPLSGILAFIQYWFSADFITVNFELLQKTFDIPKFEATTIYGVSIAINAMVLSATFNRLNLVDFFSQMAGLLYLLLTSSIVDLPSINVLVGDFFLIVGLIFLLNVKNNVDAKAPVFNVSVFFALAVLCNVTSLPLVLLIFIVLARTRSFVFREYLMVIFGFGVVAAYLFFYYFYFGLKPKIPFSQIENRINPPIEYLSILGVSFLLIFLAFLTRSRTLGSPGIRIERIVKLLFSGIFIQLLIVLVVWLFRIETNITLGVFAAIYIAYAYQLTKVKYAYNFLGYILLIFSVLQHLDLF